MLKEFSGNAVRTELSTPIDATATTMTTAAASGFPAGASNRPYVVTIGRGTPSEEQVLCGVRNGTTHTVLQRGYAGTAAQTHQAGESVEHTLDAVTVGEANSHVNDASRDDHTQYLTSSRHDSTARHGPTSVDHGSIGGLGDDDHPQYHNGARHATAGVHAVQSIIDDILPAGLVMAYAHDDEPTGWLKADGRAVSRAQYPRLWQKFQTRYGAGDGSATFNLPNYCDVILGGISDMGNGARSPRLTDHAATLGLTVGAASQTVEVANLPQHEHGAGTLANASNGAHTHGITVSSEGLTAHAVDGDTGNRVVVTGTGTGVGLMNGPSGQNIAYTDIDPHGPHSHTATAASNGAHSHAISGTTGPVGSGEPISTYPPTTLVYYLVKT